MCAFTVNQKIWINNNSMLYKSLGNELGVDRYVFFRADADTDYYRSSRPITDILNRYTCYIYVSGVKIKINGKINNNKSSDKKNVL